MLTSLDCLAKADEMAAHGLTCATQQRRDGYAEIALGWRKAAALAYAHEQWVSLHPGT